MACPFAVWLEMMPPAREQSRGRWLGLCLLPVAHQQRGWLYVTSTSGAGILADRMPPPACLRGDPLGLDQGQVPFLARGFFHTPVPPGPCPSCPPSSSKAPHPLTLGLTPWLPPYPGLSLTLQTALKMSPGRGMPGWFFLKMRSSTSRPCHGSSESPAGWSGSPGVGVGVGGQFPGEELKEKQLPVTQSEGAGSSLLFLGPSG